MLLAINSKTTGKFRRETINARPHIVTEMMPIRGDVAMNGINYPDEEVNQSFMQLNMLPAPNGHPKINGIYVPAFHPVANNAQNFGGFIRNPRKQGKEVLVEFALDEQIANQSDDGIELIKRIEQNETVEVSTGLRINQVVNKSGTDDLGNKFNREGSGYTFDHVAILLHEKAAGNNAGTELKLNTDNQEDPIFVVNLEQSEHGHGDGITNNELTADEIHTKLNDLIRMPGDEFTWVQEVFPESRTFIHRREDKLFKQAYAVDASDVLTLVGEALSVERKTEFIPTTNKEDDDMNKELMILAIIGNSFNAFTSEDKERLMGLSESSLVDALCVNVDKAEAEKVLSGLGFDFAAYEDFQINKEKFEAFKAEEKTRMDEIREDITANSEYTPEMLEGKNEAELSVIGKMIETAATPTRIAQSKIATNSQKGKVADLDYSM